MYIDVIPDMVLSILKRNTGNVTSVCERFHVEDYRFLRKYERQRIKGDEAEEANNAQRRHDKCLQDFNSYISTVYIVHLEGIGVNSRMILK
jgi:hypothetical protein